MSQLPDHYQFALASDADLLEWAHSGEPPYDKMRVAAPWLRRDESIRAYLEGVVQGNIYRWRFGYLFEDQK